MVRTMKLTKRMNEIEEELRVQSYLSGGKETERTKSLTEEYQRLMKEQEKKEKQIEEMAKDLHRNRCGGCGEELCEYKIPTNDEFSCIDYKTATALYTAGYRKASDVAEEIFAEIVKPIDRAIQFYDMLSINTFDSIEQAKARASKEALQAIRETFAKLKKKYTEEDLRRFEAEHAKEDEDE